MNIKHCLQLQAAEALKAADATLLTITLLSQVGAMDSLDATTLNLKRFFGKFLEPTREKLPAFMQIQITSSQEVKKEQ